MEIFTKSQVDKLGTKIRGEKNQISEATLIDLQDYRTSHKETLSKVFNTLCAATKLVTSDSIVTYRIKRFESIIGKLNRLPEMKFSRMWDIGGCRCIVRNDKEVYRLKDIIEKELVVKKVNDYIKDPKEEGYRSLHLYVCIPNDGKVIEVQIRNMIDHNWATNVEITDLLFDAKLKEYGYNKELLRFHFLLSKKINLSLEEKGEIADITNKYSYFDKISEVFSRNYLQVRKQWLDIESNPNHKFFLIETQKDQPPKISSFLKFNEAEEKYLASYRVSGSTNMVLTHLPTPSYRHISMAYSNYILTVHSFQDDLFDIMEELILDSLKAGKYRLFLKYYNHYNDNVITHVENIAHEIISNASYMKNLSRREKIRIRKKEREWNSDMSKQFEKRNYYSKRLQRAIQNNWPKSVFRKFLVSILLRINSYMFNRKWNRLTRKLESVAQAAL